jgi:hypothetical protein
MAIYSRPAPPAYCNNFDSTFKKKPPKAKKRSGGGGRIVISDKVSFTKKEWEALQLLVKWQWLRRVPGVKKDGGVKKPGDQWEPWDTRYKGVPREFTRTVLVNRLCKKLVAELDRSNPNRVYITVVGKAVGKYRQDQEDSWKLFDQKHVDPCALGHE